VRRLLAEVQEVSMTPKEQYIRESLRIKSEMIKELITERDSLEYRMEVMKQTIKELQDELTRLKS
jgi:predicted RNase H-like nuclease (RuvC/YqgF family)